MAHGITQNDTMFSVKETPWHKLGVVIQSAPTIADAIKLAGLDWGVTTEPLFAADGTPVSAACVRRVDTKAILGDHVGPDWTPLQNKDAFQWFSPFLESGLASLETAGSLNTGRRVWVLAKINRAGSEITPGDVVDKFLLLSNSHDGTLAVRCGYTPIRVVCQNTMSMAHGDKRSGLVRLKHTKSLKVGMVQAQEMIAEADAEFESTADVFRTLAKRSITGAQFREYVKTTLKFSQDKEGVELSTRGENLLAQIIGNFEENRLVTSELLGNFNARQEIEKEAHEIIGARVLEELTGNLEAGRGQAETQTKKGPTWWHALNAITEHITHQRGRTAESRLDQSWFGVGATLNKAALTNAVQMSLPA